MGLFDRNLKAAVKTTILSSHIFWHRIKINFNTNNPIFNSQKNCKIVIFYMFATKYYKRHNKERIKLILQQFFAVIAVEKIRKKKRICRRKHNVPFDIHQIINFNSFCLCWRKAKGKNSFFCTNAGQNAAFSRTFKILEVCDNKGNLFRVFKGTKWIFRSSKLWKKCWRAFWGTWNDAETILLWVDSIRMLLKVLYGYPVPVSVP